MTLLNLELLISHKPISISSIDTGMWHSSFYVHVCTYTFIRYIGAQTLQRDEENDGVNRERDREREREKE